MARVACENVPPEHQNIQGSIVQISDWFFVSQLLGESFS